MPDPSLPGTAPHPPIGDAELSRFFSSSYSEARGKFLEASTQAGCAVQSHIHPSLKGPSGEDLAMDVARFGPEAASRVIVFSCGTHGLEAAAGAATILQWLDMDGPAKLPDGMAVLIIHAVNPFGWAWAQRINEDGIDLNRNFIDWKASPPINEAYNDIHGLLLEATMDEAGLRKFAQGFHDLAAQKGMNAALTGITSGQYDFPDGLSFGGNALSWSGETLFHIARQQLCQASKIAHIDWHTGIGSYGQPHFILDEAKTSDAYAVLSGWWPDHVLHCDDVIDGVSIFYNGILMEGLRDKVGTFSSAEMVNLTIEWGTYGVEKMLQALVMDNWLKHRRDGASPAQIEAIRQELIERFYPQSVEWRQAVLDAAPEIYDQAIAGLDTWGRNQISPVSSD